VAGRVQAAGHPRSLGGGRLRQKATLVNTSGVALRGPLWLALRRLGRGVRVLRRAGVTSAHGPHSPYVAVPLPGNELAPGARVTVALNFVAPPGQKVRFRPLVLAGTGTL
jgi:hypothetical protein